MRVGLQRGRNFIPQQHTPTGALNILATPYVFLIFEGKKHKLSKNVKSSEMLAL